MKGIEDRELDQVVGVDTQQQGSDCVERVRRDALRIYDQSTPPTGY